MFRIDVAVPLGFAVGVTHELRAKLILKSANSPTAVKKLRLPAGFEKSA